MYIDFRQLQCFTMAAHELNFSRAADRLNMTQPPLSRQIAQLEDKLGTALFERSPKSVVLTAAGLALLPHAQDLLDGMARLPDLAQRAALGHSGSVRIGFVGSTIYTSIPALLGQFRKRYPNVSLTLLQLTVARQTQMLLAGEIDVGIIRQPIHNSQLQTRSLFKESFVLALPVEHPLLKQEAITLKALRHEHMVAFSRDEAPAIFEQMQQMCLAAGFSPNIVQQAHPMSTVVGLVGAGVGVAIVPESMQRLTIQNVVYRPLKGTKVASEFFLAWKKGKPLPSLKNFLDVAAASRG